MVSIGAHLLLGITYFIQIIILIGNNLWALYPIGDRKYPRSVVTNWKIYFLPFMESLQFTSKCGQIL